MANGQFNSDGASVFLQIWQAMHMQNRAGSIPLDDQDMAAGIAPDELAVIKDDLIRRDHLRQLEGGRDG